MEDLHQEIQQETVDTITNRATATTADQATDETLTAINSQLSQEIIAVNQKLVKLMEENKKIEPNPPVGGVAAIASDKQQRALVLFLLGLWRVESQPHLLEQKAMAQG